MSNQEDLMTFKKALIESITRHYKETIDYIESAFEVLMKPKVEEGKIVYEFPPINQDNVGPIIWFHKQLKEQQEKGHIKDLHYLPLQDKTVIDFILVKKEDKEMIEKWYKWAKEKASKK
ncbi:MAG: hypothetical protein QXE05_04165 [Nitrososphaeria archaeon]